MAEPMALRGTGRRSPLAVPFSSRISGTSFGLLLVAPVAVLLLAIVIYPVLYSLYLSLVKTNPLTGAKQFVGFPNYASVLTDSGFWHSTLLTALYVLCVTVLAAAVALGTALLLKEKFAGRAVLMALVVLPWSLSTYAAAVVWNYMYSPQYGFLASLAEHLGLPTFNFLSQDTVIPALALVHAWQFAPLGTYFLLATLQVIPDDLYKLAKVDGMGVFTRFRTITFPYIRVPFSIFVILVSGQAAMAFDLIYFLTSGGPGGASRTLTFATYQVTFQNQDFGTGAAMSWILLLAVTALTAGYYVLVASNRGRKGAR